MISKYGGGSTAKIPFTFYMEMPHLKQFLPSLKYGRNWNKNLESLESVHPDREREGEILPGRQLICEIIFYGVRKFFGGLDFSSLLVVVFVFAN